MLLAREMFDLDSKEEKWAGELPFKSDKVQPQNKKFSNKYRNLQINHFSEHQGKS